MSTVKSLISALTIWLKVLPLIQVRYLNKEIDDYDDEIYNLASSGSPSDKLRMELIAKRRGRAIEQVSVIRSFIDNPN